jgi:hypothetical protein
MLRRLFASFSASSSAFSSAASSPARREAEPCASADQPVLKRRMHLRQINPKRGKNPSGHPALDSEQSEQYVLGTEVVVVQRARLLLSQ